VAGVRSVAERIVIGLPDGKKVAGFYRPNPGPMRQITAKRTHLVANVQDRCRGRGCRELEYHILLSG